MKLIVCDASTSPTLWAGTEKSSVELVEPVYVSTYSKRVMTSETEAILLDALTALVRGAP